MLVRLELSPEAPPDAAAAIWEPLVSATADGGSRAGGGSGGGVGRIEERNAGVSVEIGAGGLDIVDGLGELIGKLIELGLTWLPGSGRGSGYRRQACRLGWCW